MPDHRLSGLFVGLATLDIIYSINGALAPNSKNVARRQALCAGGPAASAAATFSALGGRAALAAIVGQHVLAGAIKDDLGRCDVRVFDLAGDFSSEPSFSSIFVDAHTGERIVVSANTTRLPMPSFDSSLVETTEARILLVDGHLMEAAIAAAMRARDLGVPVVLDGGSWKQGTERLIQFLDVAICSQDFHPPGTGSEYDTIEYLRDHGVLRGAITRGGKAIRSWSGSLTSEIPVPDTEVVDTLGAGDVFHGAFCLRYAGGVGLDESLRYAAEVASFKCRFFGTRDWMKEHVCASRPGAW